MFDIKTTIHRVKRNILNTNNIEYYKTYYDEGLSKNPNWQLDKPRSWQLELLKKFGLQSNHKLLDYGFGLIVGSQFIIDYLNEGNFVGVEISKKTVDEAYRRIKMKNLDTKNPQFLFIDFPSFDCLKNMTFDYVWSTAVISHNPPESVKIIFSELKKHLHSKSKMFFNFHYSDKLQKNSFKSWSYNWDFFEKIGNDLGYKIIKHNESFKPDNKEEPESITYVELQLK